MKKLVFVLMVVFFVGQCFALYTLSGTVYYGGTSTGAPNASVHLTGGGCDVTGTANGKGYFTLQCTGTTPPKGSQMILTANASGGFSGEPGPCSSSERPFDPSERAG